MSTLENCKVPFTTASIRCTHTSAQTHRHTPTHTWTLDRTAQIAKSKETEISSFIFFVCCGQTLLVCSCAIVFHVPPAVSLKFWIFRIYFASSWTKTINFLFRAYLLNHPQTHAGAVQWCKPRLTQLSRFCLISVGVPVPVDPAPANSTRVIFGSSWSDNGWPGKRKQWLYQRKQWPK